MLIGGPETQRGALIGAEEEKPVTCDRTTERSPELIAQQAVVLAFAVGPDRRKRALRVQPAVPKELEAVAVEVLVPDLVTALTAAAPCIPFCADRPLVATRNSCSASGKGSGRFVLLCGLLWDAPSSR